MSFLRNFLTVNWSFMRLVSKFSDFCGFCSGSSFFYKEETTEAFSWCWTEGDSCAAIYMFSPLYHCDEVLPLSSDVNHMLSFVLVIHIYIYIRSGPKEACLLWGLLYFFWLKLSIGGGQTGCLWSLRAWSSV